ncbi:MAG: sulfite exporter TauE/SafE family protein [Chromatiales bacterium]|nr:sulfite exporter TauE/SafE family protein [Chromatiales bacterium]
MFSAFAGGGAGLLQFPALIFLGLPFGVALATHKVASVALGVGATLRHLREKSLERRFALFILATGLPGVVLGAAFILEVPDRLAQVSLGVLTDRARRVFVLQPPARTATPAAQPRSAAAWRGAGPGCLRSAC